MPHGIRGASFFPVMRIQGGPPPWRSSRQSLEVLPQGLHLAVEAEGADGLRDSLGAFALAEAVHHDPPLPAVGPDLAVEIQRPEGLRNLGGTALGPEAVYIQLPLGRRRLQPVLALLPQENGIVYIRFI